jgi:ribosome-binding protein aMBF1 (putative translation factor)
MAKTSKSAKTRRTSDGVKILNARYLQADAGLAPLVVAARAEFDVAGKIHDLRTKAGLSQRDLAKLVKTTASVICRLEDADYEGHSLAMLHRIAAALNRRVEIRFVALPK